MTPAPSPLSPRRALVTGGAHRLGAALVRGLAEAGWSVAVHYHQADRAARSLEAELLAHGAIVTLHQADLAQPGQALALIDAVLATGPLDAVIHSASPWSNDRWDNAAAEGLQQTDLILSQALLDLARRWSTAPSSPGGPNRCLITILDARLHDHDREHFSYQLAKRRLADLTALLAVNLAPTIRVNAVAPGQILAPEGLSPATWQAWAASAPLGRTGQPSDVWQAVNYLLSAPYVTGQILYVDGGRHLKGGLFHG